MAHNIESITDDLRSKRWNDIPHPYAVAPEERPEDEAYFQALEDVKDALMADAPKPSLVVDEQIRIKNALLGGRNIYAMDKAERASILSAASRIIDTVEDILRERAATPQKED